MHFCCRTLNYLRKGYWKRCFANLFFPTPSMDSQLVGQPPLYRHPVAKSSALRAKLEVVFGILFCFGYVRGQRENSKRRKVAVLSGAEPENSKSRKVAAFLEKSRVDLIHSFGIIHLISGYCHVLVRIVAVWVVWINVARPPSCMHLQIISEQSKFFSLEQIFRRIPTWNVSQTPWVCLDC